MAETARQRSVRAASNSFTREEIEALLALVRVLRRGADYRMIARSAPMMSVERKFTKMGETIEKNRAAVDAEPGEGGTP